jgi:hypothetical protein
MKKFCVQIFGVVPSQVEVEAEDEETAEELALDQVLDELVFEGEEIEPGSKCPSTPEAKKKRKVD